MKIVIVSPSLNINENVSGISAVTQFILNHNINNTYVHFIIGKKDNEKRNLRYYLWILILYIKWIKLLVTQGRLIIHFNLALSRNSIIRDFPFLMIARILGKRVILHFHGGDFLMHREQPLWMNFLLKITFLKSYPMIVLSELEKQVLKNKFKHHQINVLPNCVELKYASDFCRNYENHTTIILFIGRISADKGIHYIYNALQTIKSNNIDFKFIMAGKGPDENIFIPRFIELLGDDFEFKGIVTGDLKNKLFEGSDIFLLPSFYEGLPMALLETMSFGLVPVITNVGSVNYVVKDGINGILIQPYSSEEISNAIENLVKNKKYLTTLSENARQYILRNFQPESYMTRLNEIYKHV